LNEIINVQIQKYGCETWSLALREEHTRRWRMFVNRVLRRTFGPKRKGMGENGEDCIMRIFITGTIHQIVLGTIHEIVLGSSNQGG
jgi:hypothetical protein